jgi:hypothetical protein
VSPQRPAKDDLDGARGLAYGSLIGVGAWVAIGALLVLLMAGCTPNPSPEGQVRVLWVYHEAEPVLLVPNGLEQVAAFDTPRECVAAAKERVAFTAQVGRESGATVSTPNMSGMYRVIIRTQSGRVIADSYTCWPVGVTPAVAQ